MWSTTPCQLSFNIRSTYVHLQHSLLTEGFSYVSKLRRLNTAEKPSGAQSPQVTMYTTSLTFNSSTLRPHSAFMCFVCAWEQTAIISLYNINWLVFITKTECVYCAVSTGYLYTARFNIKQFYVLPHTAVFMCFVWIWEQTAIISLYNFNWLVFINETESVYCAVRTGYLYTILRSASHTVFMCFVWISEQTAIISLYNINWLVFIT